MGLNYEDCKRAGILHVWDEYMGKLDAEKEPVVAPSKTSERIKRAWATILSGTLICEECSKEFARTAPKQRFCFECSERRSVERKAKWAKANRPSPETNRLRAKLTGQRKRSRLVEVGSLSSESNRRPLSTVFADETGMAWVRRLSFPFSYALSKNHMASMRGFGHVFLRKNSRAARDKLTAEVMKAVDGVNVVQGKLWIDLMIHKPNHRGDAINILDLVMDGIKDALPVDDRWFALKGLDWAIVKDNPEVLIGLGQEVSVDHRICSYCGRMLPLCMFYCNGTMPGGRGRSCEDCERASRCRKPAREQQSFL